MAAPPATVPTPMQLVHIGVFIPKKFPLTNPGVPIIWTKKHCQQGGHRNDSKTLGQLRSPYNAATITSLEVGSYWTLLRNQERNLVVDCHDRFSICSSSDTESNITSNFELISDTEIDEEKLK